MSDIFILLKSLFFITVFTFINIYNELELKTINLLKILDRSVSL